MREKGNLKLHILALLLAVVAVISVGIAVWAVCFRETDEKPVQLVPDVAPTVEANAETIPGDNGEKLDKPENGGSVSLQFGRKVTVDLKDGKVSLIFANPGKSNQAMVLQIVVQETVIVQSGTLEPGMQVTTLQLLDGMEDRLPAGTYEGCFNVLYYDLETGEKSIVNTEIPITITVIN